MSKNFSANAPDPIQNGFQPSDPQNQYQIPRVNPAQGQYPSVIVVPHPLQYPAPVLGYPGQPQQAFVQVPRPIVYSNLPQVLSPIVTLEQPHWDYNYGCFVCQKLQRPQGDQFSVIAPATVVYSPFIRAYYCTRALLPFLLNGLYQLDWPQNTGLVAFTSQQELEQVCANAESYIQQPLLKVRPRQARRLKRIYHIIMVIGDILIIIGLIVWFFGVSVGFIGLVIGVAMELVDKWCIQRMCRTACEDIGHVLVAALQASTQHLTNKSIIVSVGAYGTYIRFALPQVRLQ